MKAYMLFISSRYDYVPNFIQKFEKQVACPCQLVIDRINCIQTYEGYCKNDSIRIRHDTFLGSIWNFSMLFISSRYDYVANFIQKFEKQEVCPYQLIIDRINYVNADITKPEI